MKKVISLIMLLLVAALVFAACNGNDAPAQPDPETPTIEDVEPPPPEPTPEPTPEEEPEDENGPEEVEPVDVVANEVTFPGLIAIVTNTIDQNEEEFRSAEALVERFGADRVLHRTWPVQFGAEGEMMISILTDLASNLDVGAIIINQAVINTNAAIDAVREIRGDDIFIGVANPAEDPGDVYARVDLGLDVNNPAIGARLVEQAISMGAETIAHYSFPRHMAVATLAARRDNMRVAAEAAGLRFVELPSPDPLEDGGMAASQLFISQDVGRQVEYLGPNTVFFSTNCGQQIPLLQQVIEYGAMYAQPCCPSPFHAFPQALGLAAEGTEAVGLFSISEIIGLTRDAINERGLSGRFSNWAVPASMAHTEVAFMYAVEWLNGTVSREVGHVDEAVLLRLYGDYIERMTGERAYPDMSQLQVGDDIFSTIYVFLLPYLMY